MVKLTMVARVTDGILLAEGLDDGRDMQDAEFYKQQIKALFKNLSRGQVVAARMSVETGPYVFHYIIEEQVCYLTMCDHAYPKKLAFQYLEDLKNEFEQSYGSQIETTARPNAFIKFDTFIQRTKKLHQDTKTKRSIAKLNDELYEVHQVMTRNLQEVLGVDEKLNVVDLEAETSDSDNSREDPSFDVLEETLPNFSNLSIKKKSRSRVHKELGEDVLDSDADGMEMSAPGLDANDHKRFEIVQKIIEDGEVEKLKVEQCKLYLRKHGLRLTGKKDILIQRIKEHISIMNDEGEHKYPASSFVMNCKGDACTGDIVMFEQNVYEVFNIASRSASGPPCGTRVVAGRIVKESYGAAKQQHTFTIEVLWSKGVKPLPPLHPLLIKGRNLYRLTTKRQRWEDERQRQIILSEKHARGNTARSNREARLQEKERKKALREIRASRTNIQNEKQEKKRKASSNSSRNPINQDLQTTSIQHGVINLPVFSNTHAGVLSEGVLGNHQSLASSSYKENINVYPLRNPNPVRWEPYGPFGNTFHGFHPSRGFERHDVRASFYPPQSRNFHPPGNNNEYLSRCHYQGQSRQSCRYCAQGRCWHHV